MREILAGNISRYRKNLGLTQEALADKLAITSQAVSKWETGQTVPDWYIEQCTEFIFDCNSSGISHRHANNLLFAKNLKEA